MGSILRRLGRYQEALAAYDRALQGNPEHAIAWNNKAELLIELGEYLEAGQSCEQSIRFAPSSPQTWKNRGRLRLRLGLLSEAKIDLQKAITLAEHFSGGFESLAEVSVLEGNWDEVEILLTRRFLIPERKANSMELGYLHDFIATLFRATGDRATQLTRVTRLAQIADEAKKSPMLGDSLVRSLTKPAYAEAFQETRDSWVAAWQEAAKRYPDLSLAVRLFTVGMRYVQSKDERVLFDLLQEERAILRDLFRLDRGKTED